MAFTHRRMGICLLHKSEKDIFFIVVKYSRQSSQTEVGAIDIKLGHQTKISHIEIMNPETIKNLLKISDPLSNNSNLS
jgi:hypothetical protein